MDHNQMMNAIVRVALEDIYDRGNRFEDELRNAMKFGFGFPPLNTMTAEEVKNRYDWLVSQRRIHP